MEAHFDKIYDELAALTNISQTETKKSLKFNQSIEMKNLNFGYEENKFILNNINLKIKKGDIIGIIGKSGSGKSTLVNLLSGLLSPDKGTIFIDGVNVHSSLKEYQSKIGYVSQSVVLLDESIKKNIAFEFEDDKIDIDRVSHHY